MTDNRTNEQIVAEELANVDTGIGRMDPSEWAGTARGVVEALRTADRLAKPSISQNNEGESGVGLHFSDEQVEGAQDAFALHLPSRSGIDAYWCGSCKKVLDDFLTARKHALTFALAAAANTAAQATYSDPVMTAPQAEAYDHCCNHPKCPGGSLCCCVSEQRLRGCWNQWREEIAGDTKQAFRDAYMAGQNDPAPWIAPVLPSSTVDETAIEERVVDALVMTDLSDYAGTDMGMIRAAARAVVEAIGGGGL